jgi:hypothetical protein
MSWSLATAGSQIIPMRPTMAGLLRVEYDGARTIVLDRLSYPTAMLFSPTGDLYIAVNGAFTAPGQGSILKVACFALATPEACPRQSGQ